MSTSMGVKSIGVLDIPREDNGVTISPRDMTNGSSHMNKSRNRNLLKLSRGKLKLLLPIPIRDLLIRASQLLVPCTEVQPT